MLPGIYEFRWDAGHLLFVGIFLLVLATLATSTLVACRRARRETRARAEALRWEQDFEALPAASRRCRHELSGEVQRRQCDHAFDCRSCATHATFLARDRRRLGSGTAAGAVLPPTPDCESPGSEAPETTAGNGAATPPGFETVQGLVLPLDRMYDRRHTWAQVQPNGHVRLGLDALAERLLGPPDAIELPALGTALLAHGTAWRLWKRGADVRVPAPLEGIVCALGGPEHGFYVELETDAPPDLNHLLQGREVRPWMLREVERLQALVTSGSLGTSLADGGELLPDPAALDPGVAWSLVWDDLFLQA